MRRPPNAHLLAAAAAALTACATARPAAREAAPAWPGPPAPARARLAAQYPPGEARQERSFWRRTFDAVVGVERAAEAEAEAQGALARPFAVAADGEGVLVADPDGARVLRVAWREGRAEELTCAGRAWSAPIAIAAAPDGGAYVADGDSVVRVTRRGCSAFGAGALERPAGVAVVGGRVYVVDPPRHDVVVFGPDGAEVGRFGSRGDGDGQLNFPTAIAAAPDGTLLVVDALNFRVVRFDAAGAFVASFGDGGDGEGAFDRPKAVAVDGGGRVYVSDAERDHVAVFGADGRFEYALGASGSGAGELLLPAGVAIGGGHLFVADSHNRRVQVFELVGDRS
jgi:DNA-binding beta-propeller fold protein YncE